MKKKQSFLSLLSEKYPFLEREELYSQIICGDYIINSHKELNPKSLYPTDAKIEINPKKNSFVSRGGLKLKHALEKFNFTVKDRIFIDAGASTGGFTDCLLQNSARFIYAVDSGYNQLDYSLRKNERVAVFEKTAIQNFILPENTLHFPEYFVMDISFQSIKRVILSLISLTTEKEGIILFKPQFEWENPAEDFNGIVPEEQIDNIVEEGISFLRENNIEILNMTPSPIRGTKGNKEFLIHIKG